MKTSSENGNRETVGSIMAVIGSNMHCTAQMTDKVIADLSNCNWNLF